MKTKTINTINGNQITFKHVGKMWFKQDTTEVVCNILNALSINKTRVKIYFGDSESGVAWIEEHDSTGTISHSTGEIKVPLLKTKVSNMGGIAICTNRILAIRTTVAGGNMFLYRHPKFIAPKVVIKEVSGKYSHETWVNGELYGRHKSFRSAQICQSKIA